jgi:hypothetical protein
MISTGSMPSCFRTSLASIWPKNSRPICQSAPLERSLAHFYLYFMATGTHKFIDTFFGDRFVESYVDTASVNKKLDIVKKPLQIVTAAGIALAVITFFVLIYLILRLLFGFGLALVSSAYKSSNHAVSENQVNSLLFGPQIKVSTSTVHIKKGHTEPVYAQPAPHN